MDPISHDDDDETISIPLDHDQNHHKLGQTISLSQTSPYFPVDHPEIRSQKNFLELPDWTPPFRVQRTAQTE
jgi:hypothetical protein